MKRLRFKFAATGTAILGLLATGLGVWWSDVRAWQAGKELRSATHDEARSATIRRLLELGNPGALRLTAALSTGSVEVRSAVLAEVGHLPPTHPAVRHLAGRCRASFAAAGDAGRVAILDLVPILMSGDEPTASAGRDLVSRALADESPAVRAAAIPFAMRPDVGRAADVATLLAHPSADVRRAAALAVAPPPLEGPAIVPAEELFRHLHDADADVRALVAAGLIARGLSQTDVTFGRRLASPAPRDRLDLLFELRWAGAAVKDPGPWLQRLAADPEPAVRAGAARVAGELGLSASAGWLDRLAEADVDPSVRFVAGYYRAQSRDVRPVGYR